MLVDTNILIACLKAQKIPVQTVSSWHKHGRPLFVSSISVAEVLSLQSLTKAETQAIRSFLQDFIPLSFDHLLAEQAGELRRTYRLSLPDAAIVATAYLQKIPLITRDQQIHTVKEITVVSL